MYEKFKELIGNDAYFYGFLILLVALTSFGLGRLSVSTYTQAGGQHASVVLSSASLKEQAVPDTMPVPSVSPSAEAGEVLYVASKNGTKYHLPWCPGAGQIKEENKVWFKNKGEAEASGYTPAANCKGI